MLIAFLIMLREGIEAALIVGIVAGFLKQSGHHHLMNKVWRDFRRAVVRGYRPCHPSPYR